MINLSRFFTLRTVLRSCHTTKQLFASTTVLAEKSDNKTETPTVQSAKKKQSNPTIAAVFATLNDDPAEVPTSVNANDKKFNLDEIIGNAKTVNGLLSITENNTDITRKHALKIVSILAEWSSINKVKLVEFENDTRFTKLCRLLGRTVNFGKNGSNGNGNNNSHNNNSNQTSKSPKKIAGFRTDDLNTVLGVTGDDEAAKLVASITLPQMVKVMSNLASKKRRSTPLLRSLAFNMSSKEEKLDIKQCADVLYAMAVLSFPDPVLTAKICDDVQIAIKNSLEKSSSVGSIVTSLALLKYRDPILLDSISEWILTNQDLCRTQDIIALIISIASLNYMPAELEEGIKTKLATTLTVTDFKKSSDYLYYVWSSMVLNCSTEAALSSVLEQNFIQNLMNERKELSPTIKMKLLNINGGANLYYPEYKGTSLDEATNNKIFNVPLIHNKEKQVLVQGMVDALKTLVPDGSLTLNENTNMGFVIDAMFMIDDKSNPLAKDSKTGKKIAIMVHDYRDMCQGTHQNLNGITSLNLNLLTKAGYKVISVPYNEFSISDKLLKRVQYLEKKIKEVASSKQ
ncbi:unnamed protein product [Diamesa tonsa]